MKSSSLHDEETNPGFQIAPMVDVVFVLMIFFMACAGFRATERELNLSLPGRSVKTTETVIEIAVAPDGAVLLNNAVIGGAQDRLLPALTQWLRDARETFGDGDLVVIRPAPTTTHERVMEVLSAAAAAHVKKLSLS